MLAGWAGGGEEIAIPHMPGYKGTAFREGDLYLLDCYCVTPYSSKSAGTTTIWLQDKPVWVMQYHGYYKKRAISFLKRALCQAYEQGIFLGGRGPKSYAKGSLTYTNTLCANQFLMFWGRERITTSDKFLGYHDYSGMSLM